MHDRNGTPLQVGDIVVIKSRISAVYAADEYCNATLAIGYEAEHGPHNVTSSVTVNTKQTLLVEKAKPAE